MRDGPPADFSEKKWNAAAFTFRYGLRICEGFRVARLRPFVVIGVFLILIGVAALIHPAFSYRVARQYQQVGPMNVLIETRKVIHFPLWFSVPMLTIGAALVIGGWRKD